MLGNPPFIGTGNQFTSGVSVDLYDVPGKSPQDVWNPEPQLLNKQDIHIHGGNLSPRKVTISPENSIDKYAGSSLSNSYDKQASSLTMIQQAIQNEIQNLESASELPKDQIYQSEVYQKSIEKVAKNVEKIENYLDNVLDHSPSNNLDRVMDHSFSNSLSYDKKIPKEKKAGGSFI